MAQTPTSSELKLKQYSYRIHSVLILAQGNGWKDRSYGLQSPACITTNKFQPGASIITLEYSSQKIDIYRLGHAGMATVDVRGY